jgi:sugar phosphate isomerase/epimerase
MQIGVSNYTWPWAVGREGYEPKRPLDVKALVELAHRFEVEVLQIADKPVLHEMDDDALHHLATYAEQMGITLEVGTRGIEPDHLLSYLRIAKKLKSKILRSIAYRLDREAESWLKEVLPMCTEAGVSIALENHDEHGSKELADFIDHIGSPVLGVCLDTVNSFAALESPETVVKTLAPFTLNLHIKDFDVVRFGHELGFSIVGRPAGEGRLDIRWIIEQLSEAGQDPNAILELWTPFSESVEKTIELEAEWADRSLQNLRSII